MKNFDFSFYDIDEKINKHNLINCFIIPENINLESLNKVKLLCKSSLNLTLRKIFFTSTKSSDDDLSFKKDGYSKFGSSLK